MTIMVFCVTIMFLHGRMDVYDVMLRRDRLGALELARPSLVGAVY